MVGATDAYQCLCEDTTADLLPMLGGSMLDNLSLVGPHRWWLGNFRQHGRPGLMNRLTTFLTRARAFSAGSAGPSAGRGWSLLPSYPKTGIWQPRCRACYPLDLPTTVTGKIGLCGYISRENDLQ